MISGGEIRFDTTRVQDTDNNQHIDDQEIEKGLVETGADGIEIADASKRVSDISSMSIGSSTEKYSWKQIKEAMHDLIQQHEAGSPGSNYSPNEVDLKTMLTAKASPLSEDQFLKGMQNSLATLLNAKEELVKAEKDAEKPGLAKPQKDAADVAVQTAQTKLQQAKQMLRNQLAEAAKKDIPENKLKDFRSALGDSPHSTNGSGGDGMLRASVAGPQALAQQAPQGGGSGPAGGGAPGSAMFDGLNSPATTPGYAAAILGDQNSEALGNVMNTRREGQRLMMLFLYYSRMAASGDLGAMYQLTQFLSYVISKDKARQNIQIAGKLIQLQDMSRKATDALLNSNEKDEAGFAKALQKAKAEEGTISTSQKLLADMLQEFAHVTEAMTNSSKGMLDVWGRVLRTITRA